MNPVILADSRFLDGVPTATDTATGYDVLNIRDLKEFTAWKATGSGTKYLTVDCGEPLYADCLGIKKHNLGTAGAAVSVESSPDNATWTERLAPFTPTDDKAILKVFTAAQARYWRVKIVTSSVAAQIAICLLGEQILFPFPAEGPYSPAKESIEAETSRGKTGIALESLVRFRPYRISTRWAHVSRSFVETYYIPFMRDYASELCPFFYAWDLTVFPSDVRFGQLPDGYEWETPVSVLAYYDSIPLEMVGVCE